jgi:nucleolar protein 14
VLQVPFYAATLARARLQQAQQHLASALSDPLKRGDAWPSTRTLVLLRLFGLVFPSSDKRHPVLTPAGLLACSCLMHAPLARPRDVAVGESWPCLCGREGQAGM